MATQHSELKRLRAPLSAFIVDGFNFVQPDVVAAAEGDEGEERAASDTKSDRDSGDMSPDSDKRAVLVQALHVVSPMQYIYLGKDDTKTTIF